jgi:hypothetical protein
MHAPQPVLQPQDASDGSSGQFPEHEPHFTSPASVKLVMEALEGFIGFKKWLVQKSFLWDSQDP